MVNRLRWRAGWIAACLVILAVLALGTLLLPAIRAARQAARASQHSNNLKQIGLAILNFHESYKRLPAAVRRDETGRALSSWRFYILPYLEAIMLETRTDKRWDDPANRWFSCQPYPVYCWSSESNTAGSTNTNVMAISGHGTAFDGDGPMRLDDIDSDTILVIEIADSGVHWMEPGDLAIDQVPETITRGVEGLGVHVLFADGSVKMLSPDVPLEDLKTFFTIQGAKQHDADRLLGPYFLHR